MDRRHTETFINLAILVLSPCLPAGRTCCLLAMILTGCASDSQQGQVGTRDILPNARNISPDVNADNAQLGGIRTGARAQVVEVHTNGLTTVLTALGGTVILGLVFGVLLYRSRPPREKVRGQRSEVRGQKREKVRVQSSEVRGQRTDGL